MTVEEELQKAYERGVQDGMKREHALWVLAKIGQEIEHVHAVNISEERVHKTKENEHEPVAWMWDVDSGAGYSSRGIEFEQTNIPFAKHTPLYAVPPKKEWVGLTYGEQNDCLVEADPCECLATPEAEELMRSVEAKLKEKNSI
jgi:hypothetical protein